MSNTSFTFSSSCILYEDNHLLAVNKNAGELVQPDEKDEYSLEDAIREFIKIRDNKPGNVYLGIIHRIDRPVSGVVLMAKTGKALVRMNKMIQNHEIEKRYWAIVANKPEHDEGDLVHYIQRNTQKNRSYAYDNERSGAKRAELYYKVLLSSDRYYLLEIILKTGRHHQIRAQLAKIGCPIKGDLKYGFPRSNPDGSISLHARSVRFIHPVKNDEVLVIAPVPQDSLWSFFEKAYNRKPI